MNSFQDLKISKFLINAISDLGFEKPTPIQEKSFSVILSGRNVVGIAQTGTGKTLAYMLPILQGHQFTEEIHPSVLIMVPTRELVIQVVEQIEAYGKYMNVRVMGVYGGTNINTQKIAVMEGTDILVATPGRLYDLTLSGALKLKSVKKLVIDEVDVMMDLGFRYQVTNIFELLPEKRQNIMYSATMTEEVTKIIDDFFIAPVKISVAMSGTPLENIRQVSYPVFNFNTKVNLLRWLLKDAEEFNRVLVFAPSKKLADKLYTDLEETYESEMAIVHSNKSQNYRIRSITQFKEGTKRIIITTDVMARGLDMDDVSHVIVFDTPAFPENYMHRIGRTGRAEKEGQAILFFTKKEQEFKESIEALMDYVIPEIDFPEEVELNYEMIPEERSANSLRKSAMRNQRKRLGGAAFHEKIAKNKKRNLGGSYKRKLEKKYKKPKVRGPKRK